MTATIARTSNQRPLPVGRRAAADLLIDHEGLSSLVGRRVRASRLRFKPALSTSAVLEDPAGEHAPGWIQVSHDSHLDKLRKALERARQRGQRVHLVRTGDLTIAHGAIDTDPRLQKGLDGVREVHPFVSEAVTLGDLGVLRYNPQRRLVLRRERPDRDPEVVRVTAHPQTGAGELSAVLGAVGVPVTHPVVDHTLAGNRRVTVWPWFGGGDLATHPEAAAALAAGAALAGLHTARDLPPMTPVPEPVRALRSVVAGVEHLDGCAAARMRSLVSQVADRLATSAWTIGHVHGDFSADQVLVGRPGEAPVRLTDFDRAGEGPLLADLGTFAAAELTTARGTVEELPLTHHLLRGYAEVPGTPAVSPHELRTWVARALLARVSEPFRAGRPDWVAGIHGRLDQVEEVLR